jgi:hypothetical protein
MLDDLSVGHGGSAKCTTSRSIGHRFYTQVIPILEMSLLIIAVDTVNLLSASEHDISYYRLLIELISDFFSLLSSVTRCDL